MSKTHLLCPLLALALLLPTTASALTLGLSSDAEFIADFQPFFTKTFGGNVRWGDAGGVAEWEYAVVDGNDIPIPTPSQYAWGPGSNAHTVIFDYDAGAASADLDLSIASTSTGDVDTQGLLINALLVRARADLTDVATVSDMVVSFDVGGSVNLGDLVGDGDAEYVVLIDERLAGGFDLVGAADLADGSRSVPQYGFKVGFTTIPEPGSLALLSLGLVALAAARRR